MLWAIDVGNTHTVFGLGDSGNWLHTFRFATPQLGTEDEIAARLKALLGDLPKHPVAVASVQPMVNSDLKRFADEWLGTQAHFLVSGEQVGIEVEYEPKSAVGADRIANALAARRLVSAPFVVVDFGTATTFDCVDRDGRYVGGAILPGPETLMDALTGKTAKLPRVPVEIPKSAIGRNTHDALQSGVVMGYLGAMDRLLTEISEELGEPEILTTGGLGALMAGLHPKLGRYEPNLTLDGIAQFYQLSVTK